MSFWNRLTSELIDIIEWIDDGSDVIVYRFERQGNEIKNGAKLIVREGQVAIFVKEGKAQSTLDTEAWMPADFFNPGTYTLETNNLPILSTLMGWKYGFNSPFKAEIYFVKTTALLNQKWGTPNPIMLRDAEFGVVQLRAFGTYSLKISEPTKFLKEVVGTDGHFTLAKITDELRSLVLTRFTDALGEMRIPAIDLASNYNELGDKIAAQINPDFYQYGLELTKFLINNISLPPALSEALEKRSSMGILGDMQKYQQYQTAEAIGKMASNPNSAGAAAMQMGAGMAMGQQMANAFAAPQPNQANNFAAPPPPPPLLSFHVAVNGQTFGPFDFNTLRQQMQTGQLNRDSLVWKQGMAQWMPASQVPELASLFSNMPPPPPPAR